MFMEVAENVAKVERTSNCSSRRRAMRINARRELAFDEGEYVYLKVSPLRAKVGDLAYELELPQHLSEYIPCFTSHGSPQVFKVAGGANITGGVRILDRARKGYKKNQNTGMQGVMEQSLRKRGYPGKGVGIARDVSSSLRER
ncbi:hypothetical protein U9M48_034450, partial [Paspalum notatum var. saurae]